MLILYHSVLNDIMETEWKIMTELDKTVPKIAVIILTWKRIANTKIILSELSKQTFKDFTVYISNGDEKKSETIEKYAEYYKKQFKMDIRVTHDGNELYAFRRLILAKNLAAAGTEIIFYLDDDVSVPRNYIEMCLSQYEEKTYHSGFAWTLFNNGRDYYKDRERRKDNDYRIYYCGSGVAMLDAKIFLDPKLSDPLSVPSGALKVEDLWLSYYVDHVLKWKLKYIKMPEVFIGGGDSVALHKKILNESYTKAHFLRELVSLGWDIPEESVKISKR